MRHREAAVAGEAGVSMIFRKQRAQSFIEFALILPLLIIILLGVVEATLFIGSYINLLDLTRSAARFASNRDPFTDVPVKTLCVKSDVNAFDFFCDTSRIFSPIPEPPGCIFCGGFNSTLQLKSNEDDILIYVFTESEVSGQPKITDNAICDVDPIDPAQPPDDCKPWVWSDHDADTLHDSNWQHPCGNSSPAPTPNSIPTSPPPNSTPTPTPAPNFSRDIMQSYLSSGANMEKGFVVVEVIYCYHMVLNIFPDLLRIPIKIDTYSVMPLPAAQPTLVIPTPVP